MKKNSFFMCVIIIVLCSQNMIAQNISLINDSIVTIMNDDLIINISKKGAELQNITSRKTGCEYLWQGSPEFWKRRSPILFPFVGRLWQGTYYLDGKSYPMEIHGFAKDCNFQLEKEKDSKIWFRLISNEQTLQSYPFSFELNIGYFLSEKS
ncbi:MAG: hypothetical protein ACK5M7_11480 [Draconibacterium sp.]